MFRSIMLVFHHLNPALLRYFVTFTPVTSELKKILLLVQRFMSQTYGNKADTFDQQKNHKEFITMAQEMHQYIFSYSKQVNTIYLPP